MANFMSPAQQQPIGARKEAIRQRFERIMEIGTLPPIDTNDASEVKERLLWYFQSCVRNGTYACIAGAACALGVSRQSLAAWHRGDVRKPAEVKAMIDGVYAMINMQYEELMQEGEINPLAAIFLMRNNHNYTNNDDTRPISEGEGEKSPEEILRKYKSQLLD